MATEEIGVGTVVADTYEVTRLLGQGGMGQVWEAQHRRLSGKRVAVKILLAQAAADPNSYARFRREAEIASKLGHPNIVEALDFNTLANGTPYIILEFLKGESLAKRLSRGAMPLDATLAIVRQVASALAAAHREGVVHRDLKPDNIYLCPTDTGGVVTDHVKVLDFGISKIKDSNTVQTQASSLIGTPQYMSPEQASGKHAETDHRTDQFALGAIVFEMLIGQPVFAGQTLAEVITKVLFEETPVDRLAGRAPDHVIEAIKRALSKSSAERFADIGQFIAALTGRPLQTLDRAPVPGASEILPYQPTMGAVDPLGGTVAPGSPASANHSAEAFAATSANTPVSMARPPSIVKPLSNPSLAAGEVAPPVLVSPSGAPLPPATASVPASAPAPDGKSKLPLVLGGVGALLGVGAVLFVVLNKPAGVSPPPVTDKPAATAAANDAPAKGNDKPVAAKPTAKPDDKPATKPDDKPTAKPDDKPAVATSPTDKPGEAPEDKPEKPEKPEKSDKPDKHAGGPDGGKKPSPGLAPKEKELPVEAERLLKESESALASNHGKDAQRAAEKSLDVAESLRARSLIARAACAQSNIERAYNHRSKIMKASPGEWKKIQVYCKKFGLEVN